MENATTVQIYKKVPNLYCRVISNFEGGVHGHMLRPLGAWHALKQVKISSKSSKSANFQTLRTKSIPKYTT